MRSNVPTGTAGTTATDLAPASELVVLSTVPGKTLYLRKDAPLARDAKVEFASELRNAYQPLQGSRDPNVKDISFVVKTSETWDVVDDPNGYVYPTSVHIVVRGPSHANATAQDYLDAIKRMLGYLSADVVESLMRQRTAVLG